MAPFNHVTLNLTICQLFDTAFQAGDSLNQLLRTRTHTTNYRVIARRYRQLALHYSSKQDDVPGIKVSFCVHFVQFIWDDESCY